ncbi:MAG: proline dehydrogenase family protein [Anaerolineae bacterium]|nr:proline dehydrogenase family protein [Anaerolineae bacterium]MDQ7034518.1 proline dehydrogenase family protein [Anaerolineae bacterium]
MLKQSLLYLSTAAWAQNIATNWSVAKRVARRFVAGETMDDAIAVTHTLNNKGIEVTLDFLGESVTSESDSEAVITTYLQLLDRINSEQLKSSVSIKLTHIGYDISEDLAVHNLRKILQRAKAYAIKITIDMESTVYTDATIRIYRTMRDEYDFDNVGTVIQAYLRRTEADIKALASEGSRIRLCKGAYLEAPELAFPEKAAVDANYVKMADLFLDADNGNGYLEFATHDESMIQSALNIIEKQNISAEKYEFQMLYGVRSDRQQELADAGHKMRVYVPFGESWYPYFVRRLAERPANLWFFMKSLFR